jgi:hypothetical protein
MRETDEIKHSLRLLESRSFEPGPQRVRRGPPG